MLILHGMKPKPQSLSPNVTAVRRLDSVHKLSGCYNSAVTSVL